MKDPISQYLHIAGIRKDNPEWGLQYNLCHASLSGLGCRAGLDHRLKSVLDSRNLATPIPEEMAKFQKALIQIIAPLEGTN